MKDIIEEGFLLCVKTYHTFVDTFFKDIKYRYYVDYEYDSNGINLIKRIHLCVPSNVSNAKTSSKEVIYSFDIESRIGMATWDSVSENFINLEEYRNQKIEKLLNI